MPPRETAVASLLGRYEGLYLARARDPALRRRKTGTGGAVTALLSYCLDHGLVEAVAAARRTRGLCGTIVVARNRQELMDAAGSRWNVVPLTSALYETLRRENLRRVAVVCLPCQAQFLANMREFPLLESDFGERIHCIVSLFCLGTFAFESFFKYLRLRFDIRPEDVRDVQVKGDHLEVVCEAEVRRLSITELQPCLQAGCLVCPDYTGQAGDLSAGVVASEPGWTLMIARNAEVDALLQEAAGRDVVEIRDGSHCLKEVLQRAEQKRLQAVKYAKEFLGSASQT